MSMTRLVSLLVLAAALLVPTPRLLAQNRQDIQMLADLRMLQEQVSRLQLATNQLSEQLKAVNGRIDQSAEANVKTFANQQLLINQIATTLSTVREKLDDNTVRVSQLTQEFSAVRDGLRMLTEQLNSLVSLLQPPAAPVDPSAPAATGAPATGPPSTAVGPVNLPSSPGSLYTRANADYLSARYDLAIEGFQELIKAFPESPMAAGAQLKIGESFYQKKMCREAIPEFQKVVTTYRTSDSVPDALLLLGFCQADLGRRVEARQAYEQLIKQYPESTQAILAGTRLDAMGIRR
jgi:tol-pal system protein YbgF